MKLLCLDLGTTTGYAFSDGKTIKSGSESFAYDKRYEGAGMRGLRFRRWLEEANRQFGPFTELYFEEVRRHSATMAAHVYGGLMMTLMAFCEEHNIPHSSTPVGDIKTSATGNWRADKKDVIAAMKAKGHSPADDNEADAIALCYLHLNLLSKPVNIKAR